MCAKANRDKTKLPMVIKSLRDNSGLRDTFSHAGCSVRQSDTEITKMECMLTCNNRHSASCMNGVLEINAPTSGKTCGMQAGLFMTESIPRFVRLQ
jgi:hypothetical protein